MSGSTRAELTCQEFVELVTDYFEDALPERERQRFDDHLSECDDCVAYLDQIRETMRLVGKLSAEAIPEAQQKTLLEAFREWKRG